MEIKLAYQSRKGHVKLLALAISKALDVPALSLEALEIRQPLDLLLLGGAIYGGDMDAQLRALLEGLDAGLVKRVGVFGCSATGKFFYPAAKQILATRGILMADEYYYCRGGFLIANRNRPNERDAKAAMAWAEKLVQQIAADSGGAK